MIPLIEKFNKLSNRVQKLENNIAGCSVYANVNSREITTTTPPINSPITDFWSQLYAWR